MTGPAGRSNKQFRSAPCVALFHLPTLGCQSNVGVRSQPQSNVGVRSQPQVVAPVGKVREMLRDFGYVQDGPPTKVYADNLACVA